jgi:hypothetical protein
MDEVQAGSRELIKSLTPDLGSPCTKLDPGPERARGQSRAHSAGSVVVTIWIVWDSHAKRPKPRPVPVKAAKT